MILFESTFESIHWIFPAQFQYKESINININTKANFLLDVLENISMSTHKLRAK
jgi:hypothetical protein